MNNGWTWTSTDCNEYEMYEVDINRLLGGLDIKEFIYQTCRETTKSMYWLFPMREPLNSYAGVASLCPQAGRYSAYYPG